LRQKLKSDPKQAGSVAKDAQATLTELAARRAAVADRKRYTDLPDGLRDQQLKLIDKHVADFELIRHQAAKEAVKVAPGEKIEDVRKRMGAKGGYGNDKDAADAAAIARLRDQITAKEAGIKAIDPKIKDAINALEYARKSTVNTPPGYADWVKAKRADFNLYWDLASNLNDRQSAMAPKGDELRMKLLDDQPAASLKATAQALLALQTDRLGWLEAMYSNLLSAGGALKPITTEKRLQYYPKFWGRVQADARPWEGGD
jgi:hypothetical protein